MFNTYRAGNTNLNINTPGSGLLVKTHMLSKVEIVSNNSYILTKGYTELDSYDSFSAKNKCTVLQVMPYTDKLLLVEYIMDKDMKALKEQEGL